MSVRTAKKKPSSRHSSVGAELVRRLAKFTGELSKVDRLSDRFNCRTVKVSLVRSRYTPEMVKHTRELLQASQAVFAQFLGVSISAVHDWEQGLKTPRGSACRLMDEIRHDPSYWQKRLRESVVSAKPRTSR